MRSTLVFACFMALAGRALALSIAVPGLPANVTADQFLTFTDTNNIISSCTSQCASANTDIANCGTDDSCLCSNTTIADITACEQCYFDQLVAQNIKMPDPRAGSATALTNYAAACGSALNITVPATLTTLTIPPNWQGPRSLILNTGQTVVAVGAGAILGGGALMILSNM